MKKHLSSDAESDSQQEGHSKDQVLEKESSQSECHGESQMSHMQSIDDGEPSEVIECDNEHEVNDSLNIIYYVPYDEEEVKSLGEFSLSYKLYDSFHNFDMDEIVILSDEEDVLMEEEESEGTTVNPTRSKVSIPVHQSEVHLVYLMQKYRIPASCYPSFLTWDQEAVRSGYFNREPSRTFQSCMSTSMKSSIAYHAKLYQKDIRISDHSITRVFYSSFIQNIQHFLQDEYLMEDSNWAYNGNSNSFADLNTGTWWKNAE